MLAGSNIAVVSDIKSVHSLCVISSFKSRSFLSRRSNAGRVRVVSDSIPSLRYKILQFRYWHQYSYTEKLPKAVAFQLHQSHNWSKEVYQKTPMADKWKPRKLTVYLYVPNIIGYLRVLMNCYAFYICFSNKKLFSSLYFISFVCDALDGWFARKFNQVSTFGAVLDMVTDRISTACLLVILSQVYRPSLVFLSLLALDIASHWLQMYSTFLVGKASHKDVKDSSNWLFKAYYGNRVFMGYCCVACEVLYIMLFLLAKDKNENLVNVVVNAAVKNPFVFVLLVLLITGWVIKQAVNVIQMKTAADLCVDYDIDKKHKS